MIVQVDDGMFYAANSVDEAVEAYLKDTEMLLEDYDWTSEEVTGEALSAIKVYDEDDDTVHTIQEWCDALLNNNWRLPFYLCSNDY